MSTANNARNPLHTYKDGMLCAFNKHGAMVIKEEGGFTEGSPPVECSHAAVSVSTLSSQQHTLNKPP